MAFALSGDFFSDPLLRELVTRDQSSNGTKKHRTGGTARVRTIPIDITETDQAYQVRADFPGVDKKDIKVSVDGDVLTLSKEEHQQQANGQEQEQDQKQAQGSVKWHRAERSAQFAPRSIRMPENGDLAKIKASQSNGVLVLDIPKKEEKKPITIPIE